MTGGEALYLGTLGTVWILSGLFLLAYWGLFLKWVLQLVKTVLVRRILFWVCLIYFGIMTFVGVLLTLIYFEYFTGWRFLWWAGDLRIHLLYSPFWSQYMYFFILLGIGIWCGTDAWVRSQGTVRVRLGFSVAEGIEGLFIGGAVIGPFLFVAYYILYNSFHWLLDWGYMQLPL